jgi:hypothetical protein
MFKINMISIRERLFTQRETVHPEKDGSPRERLFTQRETQEVMK